jgi:uncharacterized protein (DUF2062 family)
VAPDPRPLRESSWLRAALRVWELARKERCAPHEVGWAVGVGAFVGCTPLMGLHAGIAFVAATLLRLNRLWAVAGSRVSFVPLFAVISFTEIQAAHRLRTGAWAPLSVEEVLARGKELLADWCIGSVLVGGFVAVLLGLVAYGAALRWRSGASSAPEEPFTTPSAPPAALPPSSEYPR